ncbi:hypothetical protein COU57_02060 [Candidatus Pacearchaeota archaeon CG10_big_fil_rev_8_21_14_0_10_32_14]|nr:MAG: hypothetical protein COU57_02060 [Candidatus Pacearchaeota archaeon CG10_big_fil_rev_8_21_14_0_10_32_14]
MAIAKHKKKFFDVEIPLLKKDTQILGYEISELNGRIIKYDLTRILKGKSIEMNFKIEMTDKKELTSTPIKMNMLPFFLRRMVRKGTNYIEDSFETPCANNTLRIKPFLITRRKVSRPIRNSLRTKAKEELIEYLKDKSSDEIFDDILKNKLQKILSLKLKKIYPLSLCEIRFLQVVEKKQE